MDKSLMDEFVFALFHKTKLVVNKVLNRNKARKLRLEKILLHLSTGLLLLLVI